MLQPDRSRGGHHGMSDAAASLIGPKLYERFVWPVQMRVLRTLQKQYPTVIRRLHMCGRTDPLIQKCGNTGGHLRIGFPVSLRGPRELGPDRVIAATSRRSRNFWKERPNRFTPPAGVAMKLRPYHIVGAAAKYRLEHRRKFTGHAGLRPRA